MVRPENGNAWGGSCLPSLPRAGKCFSESHLPSCRDEAVASERDMVKVSVAGGRRRSICGWSHGAVAAAGRGSRFAMETSSAVVLFPAPRKVMARSGLGCWVCTVPFTPSPSLSLISMGICFSAAGVFSWDVSTLSLSRSSPEGGKLNTSGFHHRYNHLLSPGYVPEASPIVPARCLAWSPGAVVAPRGHTSKAEPKGRARVPCPHGEGPAKPQLRDLPAWSLFVTAWERKEAIRKVLFALQR